MSPAPSRIVAKFKATATLLLGAFAATSVVSPLASAQNVTTARAEGEVLVRFGSANPRALPPGSPVDAGLRSQLATHIPGANVARTFSRSGWSLVKLPKNVGASAAISRLGQLLGASNVTSNSVLRISKTPNDPSYSGQWHLPKISAPTAWETTTGTSSIIVAVIDTGVDLNHPDLRDNLWKNTQEIPNNGIDDDRNGYVDDYDGLNTVPFERGTPPTDNNGHGTHVAGLIGAVGNNNVGVTGVNWNVRILPLRFMDSNGDGYESDLIELLEYVAALKQRGENIRITNNSYGGSYANPAVRAAFQTLGSKGILNFCAAGNGDSNANPINTDLQGEYPASFTDASIVSVAASDTSDNPAYFSNYGATSVDLAAPGTYIYSLYRYNGYATVSGTSMATPITAGAAALLWGNQTGLSAADVKDRLLSTTDSVSSWSGKSVTGGRLNVARLLGTTSPTPTPTVTPTPTPTPTVRSIYGQTYRTDPSGSRIPLAGVKVQLTSKIVSYSDKDGNYRFDNVNVGAYTMRAILKGYGFRSYRVYVRTDSASEIRQDFASSTRRSYYTISGYAIAPDGQPRQGVQVFIDGVPQALAVTDAQGYYAINDRNSGRYYLTAQGAGINWEATLRPVQLPTRSVVGAPNGRVDFGVRESNAPQVQLDSPSSSTQLTSTSLNADGSASDDSGLTSVALTLSRVTNGRTYYYRWNYNRWTTSSRDRYIVNTLSANGQSVDWSASLPNSLAGTYTLTVKATDIWGNVGTTATSWTTGSSTTTLSVKNS